MSHNFNWMLAVVGRRAVGNKVDNIATQKWAHFFGKAVNVRVVWSLVSS